MSAKISTKSIYPTLPSLRGVTRCCSTNVSMHC